MKNKYNLLGKYSSVNNITICALSFNKIASRLKLCNPTTVERNNDVVRSLGSVRSTSFECIRFDSASRRSRSIRLRSEDSNRWKFVRGNDQSRTLVLHGAAVLRTVWHDLFEGTTISFTRTQMDKSEPVENTYQGSHFNDSFVNLCITVCQSVKKTTSQK